MLFNFVLVWLHNYFDLIVTGESYVDENARLTYLIILVPLIAIDPMPCKLFILDFLIIWIYFLVFYESE